MNCCKQAMPGTGKEGTRFYTKLLGVFPDVKFDLQNIVIGPQGVFEEAHVTATHQGKWLKYEPTGKHIEFEVIILFYGIAKSRNSVANGSIFLDSMNF